MLSNDEWPNTSLFMATKSRLMVIKQTIESLKKAYNIHLHTTKTLRSSLMSGGAKLLSSLKKLLMPVSSDWIFQKL